MSGVIPSSPAAAASRIAEVAGPTGFFETLHQTFQKAAQAAGIVTRTYHLGPDTLQFRFAGPELIPGIIPALAHLESTEDTPASLLVHFFDSRSTNTKMPPPPWDRDCYGPRGEIMGYNTARYQVVYGPGTDILVALDRETSRAYYWAPRADAIPYWETSFPLRTLLHWWFRDRPCQPVHSGAVGLPQGGVMIAGRSGSGKSTTTLACLESDLLYAGDDYVLAQVEPEPWVYSLYSTAKLERHNLKRLPHLEPLVTNAEQPEQEKALLYLAQRYPQKLAHGFPIRAIFIPKITGLTDSSLAPCGKAASMMAIAPTTVIHLHGAGERTMSKLAALARRVPSFYLEMGTDLTQIPEVISSFLLEQDT